MLSEMQLLVVEGETGCSMSGDDADAACLRSSASKPWDAPRPAVGCNRRGRRRSRIYEQALAQPIPMESRRFFDVSPRPPYPVSLSLSAAALSSLQSRPFYDSHF